MTTDLAQSVIHLLQDQQGFLTSNELARELKVSSKTIQRVVSRINTAYGNNIITSEKGRGYKLDYERFLLSKLSGKSSADHSLPAERQKKMLKRLLLAAPSELKVAQLAEDFYVSESVIQSDISSLESWLQRYDLSVKRINRTLHIQGEEKDIRDALMEAILGLSKDTTMNFQAMTQGLAEHDTTFALKQVDVVSQVLKADLPYPYDVNLFSHIYVLINRIRKFVKLPIEDEDITRLKAKVHNYPDLYSVSEIVKHNLENYLGEPVAENEVYYLFQYLISARFTGSDFKTKAGTSAYTFAEALIDKVAKDIQLTILGLWLKNLFRTWRPCLIGWKTISDCRMRYSKKFRMNILVSINQCCWRQHHSPKHTICQRFQLTKLVFSLFISPSIWKVPSVLKKRS